MADDRLSSKDLGLPAALVSALSAQGVRDLFDIQAAALPHAMQGRDVLGRARTGSGKTYAFGIPLVARLAKTGLRRRPHRPRALILAPTRELVSQIEAAIAPLAAACSLRTMTVFGGVSKGTQVSRLRSGVDIVIGCPGRLADHLESGHLNLESVEITVLDEADHMADLGFLPTVKRLLTSTPHDGQRLLFSATLDAAVDVLVKKFMRNPVTVSVGAPESTVDTMTHHVLHVQAKDRLPVLVDLVASPGRTLVFTRTKSRARSLTRQLVASGVAAVELHGNLTQNARDRNLLAFSDGTAGTLVATDIAARGIHVDGVTLVVHADPPAEHKAYLHRSGRTARAGASGTVVTLMTDDQVSDVRRLIRHAALNPTTTKLRPGDELLRELAPGERTFVPAAAIPPQADAAGQRRRKPARGERTFVPAAAIPPQADAASRRRKPAPGERTAATEASLPPRADAAGRRRRKPARGRSGRAETVTLAPTAHTASRSSAAAFSSRSRLGR